MNNPYNGVYVANMPTFMTEVLHHVTYGQHSISCESLLLVLGVNTYIHKSTCTYQRPTLE